MIHPTLMRLALPAAVALAVPVSALAQGVVVDQGTFAVSLGGREVGTEEFTIRRVGVGRGDAMFANASVSLLRPEGQQELRLVLRATPSDGLPMCVDAQQICYQVDVVGPDAINLRLTRPGRRYEAFINSPSGEEHREFPAAPGTMLLERDVAHLYYFLRDRPAGDTIPALELRDRRRVALTVGGTSQEAVQIGDRSIAARRVEYSDGEDTRIVWFDRLGRVLRVSVPATGYSAVRTDLVG